MYKRIHPEFVVPESAGSHGDIFTGQLTGEGRRHADILIQFSKLKSHSRKCRIFLFPNLEQAKALQLAHGPLIFHGTVDVGDGETRRFLASDIWLKPAMEIHRYGTVFWTHTSGSVGHLSITTLSSKVPAPTTNEETRYGWFVARRCLALQILVNSSDEERTSLSPGIVPKPDVFFTLSEGSQASVIPMLRFSRPGVSKSVEGHGYAVLVKGLMIPETCKRDVDSLLLLASFASRQLTVTSHWNIVSALDQVQTWRFNFGSLGKLWKGEEPLLLRDRAHFHNFLQRAFEIYSHSDDQSLVESAVYALMEKKQTLEVKVAQLYAGIQGALLFAVRSRTKDMRVAGLWFVFIKLFPGVFDDLWPLLNQPSKPGLEYFRHAIVHGEAIPNSEFMALSYASQNLQWHLERILLVALGWDYQKSYVANQALKFSYAHFDWKAKQTELAISHPMATQRSRKSPTEQD